MAKFPYTEKYVEKDAFEDIVDDPAFFPDYTQIGGDHYQKDIQPWEYMEAIMTEEQFTGYLWGNAIKYISRWQDKGGVQDLDKCIHYIAKLRDHTQGS